MINSKVSGRSIIFEIKFYDLSLSYFKSISLVKITEYNKDCYLAPAPDTQPEITKSQE